MLYAATDGYQKVCATPKARAYCPGCRQGVIAKCGEINIWHWAHKASGDCDPWSEGETSWHYGWKQLIPAERVEVLIEKGGEKHRADIVRADGTVVELQASYISPEEIRTRERFYGKMIWLFDSRDITQDDPEAATGPRMELRPKGKVHTFRWKHPRKHMGLTQAPAFLDLGSIGVFRLEELHLEDGPPYGGWGRLFNRVRFLNWLWSTTSIE